MTKSENVAAHLDRVRALHEAAKYDEAYSLARQCVTDATILCDQPLKFRAMTAMGHVLRAKRDFEAALNVLAAALNLAKISGDNLQIAKAWNNIGGLFSSACVYDLALECFYRVTTNPCLAKTEEAYKTHANIVLCQLYKGEARRGLAEARQAFILETPEIITSNPYSAVLLRYSFVQLGLQSNRAQPAEIKLRGGQAEWLAKQHPSPRSHILADLTRASLAVAYGDRGAGIAQLEAALAATTDAPELTSDALACLVPAYVLVGDHSAARRSLDQWLNHIDSEAGRRAQKLLGIPNLWDGPGALPEQWPELSPAHSGSRLPADLRQALIEWFDEHVDD